MILFCSQNNLDFIENKICNLRIVNQYEITGPLSKPTSWLLASAFQLLICFAIITVDPAVWAQTPAGPLTNAADVISLPADQASHMLKVSLTGIVTAADPVLRGRFFIQDATGGVFVDNVNGRPVAPGDVVEVSGITYAGAFAPTVTAPKVRVIGTAPLPSAKLVSIEQLMSGSEDSQRIEISGIVRDARKDGSRLTMDLVAGGYRFRAYLSVDPGFQPENLVGAQVRVRGTAAEAHNRSLRQLVAVEVYIPHLADLVVESSESMNPFDRPVIPLDKLAQFRRGNSLAQRVHVRGAVTFQRPGQYIFLEDGLFGLQVQSRQRTELTPGEVVDAVGFLSFENYLPVLQDAVFRNAQEPGVPVKPQPATIEELQSGHYHADYISLSGKVIELTVNRGRPGAAAAGVTTMVLQASNFTFTAIADNLAGQAVLATIPLGTVLEVSGICLTQINSDGKLESFQILIRNPNDVVILQKPGWLTAQRLWIGFLIVCSLLLVIVSWTVMLSRKNTVLNFLIGEREKAQLALQQANDQLEERVKERTAQLKFEITTRKESEVQFKGVLMERTRLAQELHDTVEQTLTGIALQLDAASKLHDRSPPSSLHHLELARSLMSKSQVEVRQSIWDLRSRALEQFDLATALAEGARQITSGTKVQVHFVALGEPRFLPEVVEENLLRIGQEALANIIKHSSATRVNVELQYESRQVSLQLQDNGIGFDRENVVGPGEGHFGLLGMSERAKRLEGRFILSSQPGAGTLVRVEIPLNPAREFQSPAAADRVPAK
jgi:signal transduction histidine kinase